MRLLFINLFILSLRLLTPVDASAQSPYLGRKYLGNYDLEMADSLFASKYLEIYQDTVEPGLYFIKHYKINGTLQQTGQYRDMLAKKPYGLVTSFHSNGQKKSEGRYEGFKSYGIHTEWYYNGKTWRETYHNLQDPNGPKCVSCWDSTGIKTTNLGNGICIDFGDTPFHYLKGPITDGYKSSKWTGYYPEQVIRFEEEYHLGKLISGLSFDSLGNSYQYKLERSNDQFIQDIFLKCAKNLIYPENARRKGIQGKVLLDFIVLENLEVTDVKVKEGLGYGCDEEALRVWNIYVKKWDFGKIRGQKYIPGKMTRMVMPVFFKLG
jgi:TonB family protein